MFDATDQPPAETPKVEAPTAVNEKQLNTILFWLLFYACASAAANYFKMTEVSAMLGQIATGLFGAALALMKSH
jgi:hypothetical protein